MTEVLTPSRGRWFRRGALVATAAAAVLATAATSATAATTTDGFNPGPSRIIDTRIDTNDRPAGPAQGFVQATLPDTVPDGSSALLSVTVVDPTTSGYIKAYPDSDDNSTFPATSDVNFVAGNTVAQAVLVNAKAGSFGKVDFFIEGNGVPINMIVDVVGSFPTGTYTSLMPAQRVFDTRTPGTGTTSGQRGTGIYPVNLTAANIPDDAQSVAVTLTQVGASGPGYVSALGSTTPTGTSSLNYAAGTINSNLVFVKPDDNGRIYLQVQGAPTDLIVDVKGYSLSTSMKVSNAVRAYDSRTLPGGGLLSPGQVDITLPTTAPKGASFALLNVTSTESTLAGWLASYKAADGEMQTSNLNWVPGQDVAGFVLAPIDSNGVAHVYLGYGQTKLVADVEGYIVNAAPADN